MMNQSQYGGGFSQPQQQQKGCLGRNWKWLLPVGCLGLILIACALGVGIFFIAMSAMKSSEVYQLALNKAKANPTVVEKLGEPINDGWLVQGSVKSNGLWSEAKFSIPISGPKNSGNIYAEASRSDDVVDQWHFKTLEVEVNGLPGRISLMENSSLTLQTNFAKAVIESDIFSASATSESVW